MSKGARLLEEAYEDPKDILAGGGCIPYNGNYQKDLDVMDEIEELLESDEDAPEYEDDETAAILRAQMREMEEYPRFADEAIELFYTIRTVMFFIMCPRTTVKI